MFYNFVDGLEFAPYAYDVNQPYFTYASIVKYFNNIKKKFFSKFYFFKKLFNWYDMSYLYPYIVLDFFHPIGTKRLRLYTLEMLYFLGFLKNIFVKILIMLITILIAYFYIGIFQNFIPSTLFYLLFDIIIFPMVDHMLSKVSIFVSSFRITIRFKKFKKLYSFSRRFFRINYRLSDIYWYIFNKIWLVSHKRIFFFNRMLLTKGAIISLICLDDTTVISNNTSYIWYICDINLFF